MMCPSNQGSLAISIQVRNSVRPMHLFGHNVDHDYYFELLCEEERDTHSITRCSTSHHRLFRAFPRANRTLLTFRNPIPCASSSTSEPPVSSPWRPWRFSFFATNCGCRGEFPQAHRRNRNAPKNLLVLPLPQRIGRCCCPL